MLLQQQHCAVTGHIPVTGGGGMLLGATRQLATASGFFLSQVQLL